MPAQVSLGLLGLSVWHFQRARQRVPHKPSLAKSAKAEMCLIIALPASVPLPECWNDMHQNVAISLSCAKAVRCEWKAPKDPYNNKTLKRFSPPGYLLISGAYREGATVLKTGVY